MRDGPADGGRGGDTESCATVRLLRELSADRLRSLVASVWEGSGWRVSGPPVAGSADAMVVTRDANRGAERLLLVVRAEATSVEEPIVRRIAGLTDGADAEGAVVVSPDGFGDSTRTVADAYGVDLVDGTSLARLVNDHGGIGTLLDRR